MALVVLALVLGLVVLVWSADRFVDGSAVAARHFGVPPLLIGMVIVGFGTSAPEMLVSALAAWQGNPGLALGNAYGSNITNIAFILGLTALISPVAVHSRVLRKELPILTAVSLLAAFQLRNGDLSRLDAIVLLGVFTGLMAWTVFQGLKNRSDALGVEMDRELAGVEAKPLSRALFRLASGLVLLIAASRALVWGAVEIAHAFGVGDLVIGLTIVALGTSLPELASSAAAALKKEHDIALGNILGSNLFNTLAVVGLAGAIHPMSTPPEVFHRDIPVMIVLTISLFVFGYGFRGPGRINRFEGALLMAAYFGYTAVLVMSVLGN
ncbi:MAG: calcium/sodium antiporter [Pseudomonadota bacterium]